MGFGARGVSGVLSAGWGGGGDGKQIFLTSMRCQTLIMCWLIVNGSEQLSIH